MRFQPIKPTTMVSNFKFLKNQPQDEGQKILIKNNQQDIFIKNSSEEDDKK